MWGVGQVVTGLDSDQGIFGPLLSSPVTPVPPGPTADQIAAMMAGGAEGQAALDAINNAQFTAQQSYDASQVVPTFASSVASDITAAGDAVASAFPTMLWVLGGAAVLTLLLLTRR